MADAPNRLTPSPAGAGPVPMATVAWTLAALALVGGLAEVAIAIARIRAGSIELLDPRSPWAAPMGNLLIFGLIALGAWALRALVGRDGAVRMTLTGAAALAVFAAVSMLPTRVHAGALAVLALGVGTQVGRFVLRQPRALERWSWRVACGLGMVALAGTALLARPTGWTAPPVPSAALPPDTPNVLLLVLDTVRADELGAYGYHRPTSAFMDRLAARGTRFAEAVATAPWTLPTHVSLLTGQYPKDTTVSWTRGLDDTHRTLAQVLVSQGFRTGGFVANLEYASSAVGLDRGFETFRDVGRGIPHVLASSHAWQWAAWFYNKLHDRTFYLTRRTAADVNDDFLQWVDEAPRAPFFAFLNYFDAHSPSSPPPPYDLMFLGREPETRDLPFVGGAPPSPEATRQLRDAYDGGIAYIDAEIAKLWARLEERGIAGRTIIIVTADHGEEFQEHGLVGHGDSLYWPALHVPLIITYEGCVPPTTVGRAVSLRDLPRTILDLTGIDSPDIPGHSLAPLWASAPYNGPLSPALAGVNSAPTVAPGTPLAKGDMRSINDGNAHLVVNGDQTLELYRHREDPLERVSLVGKGAADVSSTLLARMREVLSQPAPPRATPHIESTRVPRAVCEAR